MQTSSYLEHVSELPYFFLILNYLIQVKKALKDAVHISEKQMKEVLGCKVFN